MPAIVSAITLALAVVGTLAALTYLPGVWLRWRIPASLKQLCSGSLVLTFDDGPSSALEPRVLEVLARHRAKATFFLLGARAEQAPERCDALTDAGHEIGCHSYSHANAWRVPPWTAIRDIRRGAQVLKPWMQSGRLFRPPNGKMTLWTWLELQRAGLRIAYWTHDSGDTRVGRLPPPVDELVQSIVADGGGVVLLHSFDRDQGTSVADFVVEATDAILQAAGERGWRVCTQSELFAGTAGEA